MRSACRDYPDLWFSYKLDLDIELDLRAAEDIDAAAPIYVSRSRAHLPHTGWGLRSANKTAAFAQDWSQDLPGHPSVPLGLAQSCSHLASSNPT